MKESCKSGYIFFGLIILLLSLWLCDIHSQSEKLNVKLVFKTTKAPLQDYINEIEEQSGLQFAYSSEKIPVKSKVTLPSKAISLNDFLILLSDEYNISNYVTGNQVVLFEKKPSEFFRISGYIADARTGEKLIAANIYNSNFEGTISNSYGFYSFNQPAADHFLNFSYVGYKPYKLNLNSLKDTFINVRLEPYLLLDEIQIIGREKSLIDESNPIQVLLPHQLIDNVPSVFGEGDIMKAIQLTPGTQSGLENTNGISVRGGGPGENIMLLDGVQLYHYNHLLGLLSVFDNSAIKTAKIIKGGMPANYGGRASSCIDIWLKEGNNSAFNNEVTVGFPASRILFEGPVVKGKSSFLVSGKRTLHDLIMQFPFQINSKEYDNQYYKFFDVTAKLNYHLSEKASLFISFYTGGDSYIKKVKSSDYLIKITNIDEDKIRWGNRAAAFRFNYIFNRNLFMNVHISNSNSFFKQVSNFWRYKEEIEAEHYTNLLTSGIDDWTVNVNFNHVLPVKHSLKYGGSFTRYFLEPDVNGFIYSDLQHFYSTRSASFIQDALAFENAFFIDDNVELTSKLTCNIGLRVPVYFSENSNFTRIEPRFSVFYQISPQIILSTSGTRNCQFIHLLTYTNLLLPTDLWVNSKKDVLPSQTDQFTAGIIYKWNENYSISTEVYYKNQKNILAFTEGPEFLMMNLGWSDKVEAGKGESYGTEFLLHKLNSSFTGWISYTLSHSVRVFPNINRGKPFVFKYDRPHILNVVLNYKIRKNIEAGATWIFTSGLPFTFSSTAYRSAINDYGFEIFNNVNNSFEIDEIDEKQASRMLPYHRLDLSLKFQKQYHKVHAEIKAGVYNAYNRHNPVFMYAENEEMYKMSVFPALPFLQMKFRFNPIKNRGNNEL